MGRKRSLETGALNIRVHPHDVGDEYARLIRTAFELKRPISIRGDRYMVLTSLSDPESDIFSGVISRFTDIDVNLPWLDLSSLAEADESHLSEINIPDDLRPNLTPFYFSFNAKKHKLVVETRSGNDSLSIRSALKFFDGLLNSPEVVREFGPASLTVVSSKESLEAIWTMHRLKSLEITILRPNPDVLDLERKILKQMEDENVHKKEERRKVVPGKSIEPDESTKELAEVAATNGTVTAAGQHEDGGKATFSSESHPRLERVKYDPELTSPLQAFSAAARRFFS